ncbi:S-adenosyl-L-methionine-dependent methyltransferase [Fennellomyces sp. T-0311]|nr:S-adenosyl-L-methionine-dependent methyltransferase [Fennellomyces sp. T-0311]
MLSSNNSQELNSQNVVESVSDNAETVYFLSSEESELDRLGQQYEALKRAFGGIFDAPTHESLKQGTFVLDSGCGPGQWVIEMSKEYPRSTFVGLDLSNIFPPQESRPPNCQFAIHNILKTLPFPENHFTFIHQQYLLCGIQEWRWPSVLQDFMRTLKPGGWIELTEPSASEIFNIGPKNLLLRKYMQDMMAERGLKMSIAQGLESLLANVGLMNIQVKHGQVPLVPVDHDVEKSKQDFMKGFGTPVQLLMSQDYPEFSSLATYEQFLVDSIKECIELNTFMLVHRICGQKPN